MAKSKHTYDISTAAGQKRLMYEARLGYDPGPERTIDLSYKGDTGSDPLGNGMFKMHPSGDIVDSEERDRRLSMRNPRIPRYHIALVRETALNVEIPTQVSVQQKAASVFRELFRDLDREQLAVMTLDTKHRIIGLNVVSIGTLSESVAHPREIFKMAVLQNAKAIIHGHNHPSGDPFPSKEDLSLHNRLIAAGNAIGIGVLDGIVIGESTFWALSMDGGSQDYAKEESS